MIAAEPAPRIHEELEAQRLACELLVRGCETALAQFQASGRDSRAGQILEEILTSWRETLSLLESAAKSGEPLRKLTAFTAP